MSLLLIVNIFHTLFLLLTLKGQLFPGFILKRQALLKKVSGISCVMLQYLKRKQNSLTNSFWTLYQHNPTGKSVKNSSERISFKPWFSLQWWGSHSKWPAVFLFFSQILIAGRLIRSYFNGDTFLMKSLLICCKLILVC